jgi:hypothetical protein
VQLRRLIAAAALVSLAAPAVAAPPPLPTGPLPEWPCKAEQTPPLTAAAIFGAPLPGPAPQGDWRADPAVKAAVDFAAAPENAPQFGTERIAALARAAGPNKRQELLTALTGIVERTNALRGFITDGIAEKVVKSKLLAERLEALDHDLAAMPADAPPEQRRVLAQGRDGVRRALGDNAEDAELLCHRLDYARKKAERLAAAIGEQINR